jgi:hypothetical protein
MEGVTAVEKVKKEQKVEKQKESRLRRLATHLWEEGWSRFQVVPLTLFWGPMPAFWALLSPSSTVVVEGSWL